MVLLIFGCKNEKPAELQIKKSNMIAEIIGLVKVYGNEPHTFAGIAADDGKIYEVDAKYQNEFRNLQGARYRFTGYIITGKGKTGYLFIPVEWAITN